MPRANVLFTPWLASALITVIAGSWLWPAATYADSLSPLLIPGFSTSSAGVKFVVLATLLAAVIEIPYVSRAGVEERVWRRTVIANVISTIVGIFFPAYFAAHSKNLDVYIAVAIALSIVVEGVYLSWAAARRLNWGWLIAGNMISAIVLLWLSSIWAVSMDRAPDALRDLGADVHYSWYRRQYMVTCVNPKLVDDTTIREWVPYLNKLRVRSLDLSDSKVTDAGLTDLSEVPSLTRLSVRDTGVTNEGIGKLQLALPRVLVYPTKAEPLLDARKKTEEPKLTE